MTGFAITCSGCGNKLKGKLLSASTYTCQNCGNSVGKIALNNPSLGGAILLKCLKCQKSFLAKTGVDTPIKCPDPKCGWVIVKPEEIIPLSQVMVLPKPIPISRPSLPLDKQDQHELSVLKSNLALSIKIAIPYYKGGDRIERAIRTWISPNTVFILTDQGTIPPGYGISSQIFTSKNSCSLGIGKKTKPFIIDILSKTLEAFPDQNYYGFFNSDIILPHGSHIQNLLPSKGKSIVFHHRVEVDGSDKDFIYNLKPKNQIYVGKDGFIGDRITIQKIISNMKDMIIGGAAWDDGLLIWCWKKFGLDKVELRYGEIQHSVHVQQWTGDDAESKYNRERLEESGVEDSKRVRVNWFKIGESETDKRKDDQKVLGLIQPGRIGDIVIVLPIAKWYYDKGYKVVWPVASTYLPLFNYINYVEVIDCGSLSGSYNRSKEILEERGIKTILDLGIGFGRNEKDWKESKLTFDEWKYKEANVPFEERFNLHINRDYQKEIDLQVKLKIHGLKDYSFTHSIGTDGSRRMDFNITGPVVEMVSIPGFTPFDWIGIVEKAKHVYCADSCMAHIVNQLGLAKGRRTFEYFPNGNYGNPLLKNQIRWEGESTVLKKRFKPPVSKKIDRVLLVSVPSVFHAGDWPLYPLGIGYLSSSLRQDRDVSTIHFQRMEHAKRLLPKILGDFKPDLVGLTCSTFNRGNVKIVSQMVKEILPETKIVMGGPHVSFLPDQALEYYGADYVVKGEGENTLRFLCRAISGDLNFKDVKGIVYKDSSGNICDIPESDHIENLDDLPLPDFSYAEQIIMDSKLGSIITTRGCPARCNYCSTSHYWGQKVRAHSVNYVLDQIDSLIDKYGIEKLFFNDDTFNISEIRVKRICQGMIDRKFNLTWACHGRVHPVSKEMLDIMVKAGCRHVCWGIESGSATMLKSMNKNINLDQVKKTYDLCLEYKGILTTGAFTMVGYPGETEKTVKETCDFLSNIPLTDETISSILYVLPGTKVYEDLKREIGDSYWIKTDETFYNTVEHSMDQLSSWSNRINNSRKKVDSDPSKHFWQGILMGNIPKPKEPIFQFKKKLLESQFISSP